MDGAAIAIGPPVAVVLEELVDQMSVGCHELDAIEPYGPGVDRSAAVLPENIGNLCRLERAVRRGLCVPIRSDDADVWIGPVGRID